MATLYYGGDAFNQGQSAAEAAKIENQGQQLLGAAELFKANFGRWPNDVAELQGELYLKTIPEAKAQVLQTALAAQPWGMPTAGQPVFVVEGVGDAVCRRVNFDAYGRDGVLALAIADVPIQCFGESTGSLRAMAAKAPSAVHAALASAQVDDEGVPASSTDSRWTSQPTIEVASAPPVTGTFSPSKLSLMMAGTAQPSTGEWVTGTLDTLVLTNTGEVALSVTNLGIALPFRHTPGGPITTWRPSTQHTCVAIPAGGSCSISVTFDPTQTTSNETGTMVIEHTGAGGPLSISLTGVYSAV